MHIFSLPAMIVCRFILNLRQIEPAGSSWASGNKSVSLRFVGNLGQPLQIGIDNDEPEDDDLEVYGGDVPLEPTIATETSAERHIHQWRWNRGTG